jgi:type II secretory pathway pseudopilin PulG
VIERYRESKRGDDMTKLLNRERGFTMIEAVMVQAILIIGAVSIWSAFMVGARLNAESEDRTIAANVARLKMEEIVNTRFRYIVEEHPAGETMFESQPQRPPYWTLNSEDQWVPSLPEGKYTISYPDGVDADPLGVKVIISWRGRARPDSSLSMETLVSMTPGRFSG